MNISFIGLGKLGLPLATLLAEKNNLICIDKNKNLINSLNENTFEFNEAGLKELFTKNKKNMQFTNEVNTDTFETTDSTIILTNTQLGDDGYSDKSVDIVFEQIGNIFGKVEKKFHHFILSSTVLPGSISSLINSLERYSGKKHLIDFGFTYVPDFVKLGNVVEDFQNPDFFLVGSSNTNEYENAKMIWSPIHLNSPTSSNLTLEEVEIAKISLNAFIVNKISFANYLSVLCENIENVNVNNITRIIGMDDRIGNKFFAAGPPFGGTCFPRDTYAFISFAKKMDSDAKHVEFSNTINEMVYEQLKSQIKPFTNISILGISFKENTDVLIGSPSIEIIRSLGASYKFYIFDYLVKSLNDIEDNLVFCDSIEDAIEKSEAVLIMHNDKRFEGLDLKGKELIDPWNLYKN